MKKICIIFITLFTMQSTCFGGVGDVDGSGGIDLKDAVMALQVAAGMSPTGVQKDADVNIDSHIGLEEAVYALRDVADIDPDGDYINSLGMSFVEIPAGTFMMGSPEDELGREGKETLHQVTLSKSFYMQTTEVTQEQWEAVTGSNPSYFKNCGNNCPVEMVSWDDVQSFIVEMNKRGEGTYWLPTEAEWEYAARAGTTTAFANGDITVQYCGLGNDNNLDKMGWYCENSDVTYQGCDNTFGGSLCAGTHPAAQKQPNAWGLFDMHGNVWEWCQDWDGTYPDGPVVDPTGPETGSVRIGRGGAWNYSPWLSRSAQRGWAYESDRFNYLGFRLAFSPTNR